MALNRGARGFGDKDHGYVALAAQRFFEQMEAFRDAAAVLRECPARDGPAHVPEERISRAGNQLYPCHPLQC